MCVAVAPELPRWAHTHARETHHSTERIAATRRRVGRVIVSGTACVCVCVRACHGRVRRGRGGHTRARVTCGSRLAVARETRVTATAPPRTTARRRDIDDGDIDDPTAPRHARPRDRHARRGQGDGDALQARALFAPTPAAGHPVVDGTGSVGGPLSGVELKMHCVPLQPRDPRPQAGVLPLRGLRRVARGHDRPRADRRADDVRRVPGEWSRDDVFVLLFRGRKGREGRRSSPRRRSIAQRRASLSLMYVCDDRRTCHNTCVCATTTHCARRRARWSSCTTAASSPTSRWCACRRRPTRSRRWEEEGVLWGVRCSPRRGRRGGSRVRPSRALGRSFFARDRSRPPPYPATPRRWMVILRREGKDNERERRAVAARVTRSLALVAERRLCPHPRSVVEVVASRGTTRRDAHASRDSRATGAP